MLINLLDNAVKFTPDGGTIGLDVKGDTHKGIVRISVWDTGVGIPPDQRNRLFKPFDSTKGLTGMGIGAYESREFVRSLNGELEVDSTPGQGTSVRILLPVAAMTISEHPATPHRESLG